MSTPVSQLFYAALRLAGVTKVANITPSPDQIADCLQQANLMIDQAQVKRPMIYTIPTGLLFHITGTAAITGFNIPVGFDPTEGATICAIPDGLFTTTAANNIAVASTAVVGKTMCWAYDPGTAKFYPYY